jgi:hypothetical protein
VKDKENKPQEKRKFKNEEKTKENEMKRKYRATS